MRAGGAVIAIHQDRDEYIIGDPRTGVFFAVPEVGARIARLLADGHSVEQVERILEDEPGESVDVRDFAAALSGSGLLEAVARPPYSPGRLLSLIARALFSRAAWTAYIVCAIGIPVMFVVEPELLPSFESVYFVPDVVLSLLVANAMAMAGAAVHELWHKLAAVAARVPARVRAGRRAYFLVLETDLTALWSLPRHRRYGPFLAGLAIDAVLTAAALALRLGWSRGWWDPDPLLVRVAGSFVLIQVFRMTFQALAFLRTDLYLVLTTALGARNLHRVANLSLRRGLRLRLKPAEAAELAEAHPRDLSLARWYRILYAFGICWAAWFFVTFAWPSLLVVVEWAAQTLSGTGPGKAEWWEALLLLLIEATFLLYPLTSAVRQRLRGRAS